MEVIEFLKNLLHHLRGNVVLLWDGGTIHRAVEVKEFIVQKRRLHIYRFPGYAPELNPIEFVWTKAKHKLSNSCPENMSELNPLVSKSIPRVSRSQKLLRSCIHASDLPWRR